ncbi:MAG: aldehyde ferredoxin oxidoreductase family protein [Candidatus Acetothermia bacterium]
MTDQGKIVEVNLTTKKVKEERPEKSLLRDYLGGRGFNVRYLLEGLDGDVGPLDPENVVVLSPGALTGSKVYSSSRLHVSSLSPLTGFLGSSNVGGYVGARLRQNGIFSLTVRGRAEEPVFLSIGDGTVEIKGAVDLWGMETGEARDAVREEVGADAVVGAIGPAGENSVGISCVLFDDGHAAGRTGMGAVLGSKNLKALGVGRGSFEVGEDFDNTDPIRDFLRDVTSHQDYEEWSEYADTTSVKWVDDMGASSVKNYRQTQYEEVDKADGSSFKDLPKRSTTCYRCPIHCSAEVEITRGRHEGEVAARPHFEPLVALGPNVGNSDSLESIHLHNRCNELGLDSVDTGGLIGFAMDLYDRGIIDEKDADGLKLDWGDGEAMEELVEMIAYKDGWLGRKLSKGLKQAGREVGGEAEEYAYHVKGLAMTAMDPRGFKASALGYAIGSRGGDFTSIYARPEYSFTPGEAKELLGYAEAANRLSEEGKPELVKRAAMVSAVVDSLGICKIPLLSMVEDYDLSLTARLASDVLGEEIGVPGLLRAGERTLTAERAFNVSRGLTEEDDTLPEKFTTEKIAEGPAEGSVVDLEAMLSKFYSLMGWSEEGIPREKTLVDLGLRDLVEKGRGANSFKHDKVNGD